MPEPLSPEQYAYASGAGCPACEGTDLARGPTTLPMPIP